MDTENFPLNLFGLKFRLLPNWNQKCIKIVRVPFFRLVWLILSIFWSVNLENEWKIELPKTQSTFIIRKKPNFDWIASKYSTRVVYQHLVQLDEKYEHRHHHDSQWKCRFHWWRSFDLTVYFLEFVWIQMLWRNLIIASI